MLGLRNVFILHDYFHGFRGGGSMIGSRSGRCKVIGKFAMLRERGFGNQDQQQRSEALSPSCAMTLARTGLFGLSVCDIKCQPFSVTETSVKQSCA
jgi:hypothetical protein